MDLQQQDDKNISKIFTLLRSKLNAKEKELLELQRAQPCLLAPDREQIDALVNLISSLQLSTQDGSFIFPSTTTATTTTTVIANESSSTPICSTGVDTIKTLPSNIWLPSITIPIKEEEPKNEYRLPMVSHLLSLPVSAYVASCSPNHSTVETKPAEPSHRLPMVSQLLSMLINAFKSSSSSSTDTPQLNDVKPMEIEDKTEKLTIDKHETLSVEPMKSIFEVEPTYSKEHWLRTSSSSDSEFESISFDLDSYIEQASDKMRRLHLEYLEALDKLKTPTKPEDTIQAIKSIYPQTIDRVQPNAPAKKSSRIFPSFN
ncbi:unnamed protein product [Adineta ricciae]|uniref:Uncharacterized protein n=1 Tax=Adineta ricciae TaxID=249248 RepID=A0A814Q9L4_ADIRI|nr:unnamed protein product [Adineta ricciae]CAF1366969.1 unnamed protein product [Adineta ricciae]